MNYDRVYYYLFIYLFCFWVSLEDIKELWNDWEIQSLILVSFGLQVFLFLAADVRRHCVYRASPARYYGCPT